jgi:crotonobetainyl-CoA:carnitine CoA-transferase CaiB-like acyl-CoA transferase
MGPYATQLLAELGAEIIKVEPPGGDVMRSVGPMRNAKMGPLFLHANRNKRSIVLDLKHPVGHALLLRLLRDADAFVFNVRPQAMQRLRLDYTTVAAINPSIVYCGAYGFGSDGPYAGRPAYDDLIQGLAAIPSLGLRAGMEQPRYAPTVIADRIVGLNLAVVILAALLHRQRTGEGQQVEVPMFETMAAFVLGDHMGGRSFVPPIGETGYARLLSPHRRPFATKDGYICVVVYTDAQWRTFFSLVGEAERFENDERFRDIGSRTRHIDELYGLVARHLAQRTTAEWLDLLERSDIPAAPLHTIESLLDDEHLHAVRFFRKVEHPTEGTIVEMRRPSRWSGATGEDQSPAPNVGEHTVEILREAGLTPNEIDAALACGAAVAAKPSNAPPACRPDAAM